MSYSWFRRGTCTVTNGNARVNFQGADITTAPNKPTIGDAFMVNNSDLYEIIFIGSDSTGEYVTLDREFGETSASNAKYAMMRLASSTQNASLVAKASAAINQKQISLDDMYEWYTATTDTVDFEGPDGQSVTVVSYYKLSIDIATVGSHASKIEIVADNIDAVKAVSADITNINKVGADIDSVKSAADNMADIKAVDANKANIDRVAGNVPDINTVAGNIVAVKDVARNEANINTVHSNMSDINNVSSDIASVKKVGDDIDSVKTTAANIADVKKASDNIDAIKAAPAAAQTATDKAAEADASAKAAAASAGVAAGSFIVMTAAQRQSVIDSNKNKYAASGLVHDGKHKDNGTTSLPIRNGMYTDTSTPNILKIGGGDKGESESVNSVINIAGVVSELTNNDIHLPPASDGTVTYNKLTGENIKHADAQSAFSLANSDQNIEVVTERSDLTGLEQVVITGDEVFDMVQSQSATFGNTDVTTVESTKPDGFFAAYEGQENIKKGRCVKWSTLTDTQKRKVAAYLKERLAINENGDIENIAIVQDSKRGLGNGKWFNVNSVNGALEFKSGLPVLSRNGHPFVKDPLNKGVFTDNHGSYYYVLGTVSRLNQGVYVPNLNPSGCSYGQFPEDAAIKNGKWYAWSSSLWGYPLQCFTTVNIGKPRRYAGTGNIGGASGRIDQYAYYDAIYNGLVECLTLSANKKEYSRLLTDNVRSDVAGTTRGKGKVPFSAVYDDAGTGGAPNAGFKWNYGGVNLNVYTGGDIAEVGDNFYLYDATDGFIVYGKITSVVSGSNFQSAGDFSVVSGNLPNAPSYGTGNTVYYILEKELATELDSLPWVDLVGHPARLLATFSNGCVGKWVPVIPNGSLVKYPLNRKSNAGFDVVKTSDDGATWNVDNGWSTSPSVTNLLGGAAIPMPANQVRVLSYEALSDFTESGWRLDAEGALGNVEQLRDNRVEYGNRMMPSLTGDIAISANSQDNVSLSVTTSRMPTYAKHEPLALAANNPSGSNAVKMLPHLVEKDGLLYVQYHATQLINNGTDWGDDSEITIVDNESTKTNLNSTSVKVVTHTGKFPVAWAY